MMEAIDNLRCVFDKKACCFEERLDYCEIREKDQQATFTKLNVECDGAKFGWVANEFYAGWKSVTENLSSKLQDSDCDGAFFLCDENDQSLWLVELKSTFDTRKVEDAFRQALFTYFKLQMAFSICNSVDVKACPLHFLVGCKPFKNENHESSVFARIQEEQLLGRKISYPK